MRMVRVQDPISLCCFALLARHTRPYHDSYRTSSLSCIIQTNPLLTPLALPDLDLIVGPCQSRKQIILLLAVEPLVSAPVD